jgi:hypothetical protein
MSSSFENSEIPIITALRYGGENTWISGNPYLVLLKQYLDAFLPINTVDKSSVNSAYSNRSVSDVLSDKGGLLLRLAIDFWIDANLMARYKLGKSKEYMIQRKLSTLPALNLNNKSNSNIDIHKGTVVDNRAIGSPTKTGTIQIHTGE